MKRRCVITVVSNGGGVLTVSSRLADAPWPVGDAAVEHVVEQIRVEVEAEKAALLSITWLEDPPEDRPEVNIDTSRIESALMLILLGLVVWACFA